MKYIKPGPTVWALLTSVLLAWLNPFNMTTKQCILFSGFVFTAALWATEAVHKTVACAFLLLVFAIFGKTSLLHIVSQMWSETILLIIGTTWLSVGLAKTGVIQKAVERLLQKCGTSIWKLLLLPYLFGIALVFLIPQAFSRVILLGTIFDSMLSVEKGEKRAKRVLLFNVFVAVSMSIMFFRTGDLVLNSVLLEVSGSDVREALSSRQWFVLMSVPTAVTCLLSIVLIRLTFRRELREFQPKMILCRETEDGLSPIRKRAGLLTMGTVIFLWMTQRFHGISPCLVAGAGCVVMFATGVLERRDIGALNPHLLLFLVTIFNIGKVFREAGITEILFQHLEAWIPQADSSVYLLIVTASVMAFHMCTGASVAALSVVVPIILPLTTRMGYPPETIALMTYAAVNVHFLMPFHNATLMIGVGRGYYPERYMARFGARMTVLLFPLFAFCYFSWWRWCGAL